MLSEHMCAALESGHLPSGVTVSKYLKGSRMRRPRIWGTDIELLVFADLIGCCIKVFMDTLDEDTAQIFHPYVSLDRRGGRLVSIINYSKSHYDAVI